MIREALENLGFQRTLVPMEESGDDRDFYYYSLNIGDITLMSNDDEQAKKEGWKVIIFDYPSVEISDYNDLAALINILESNNKKLI